MRTTICCQGAWWWHNWGARPYTQTEVVAALTSPQSRTLAGIPASAAEGVVAQRWQTVGLWRAQEETLARRCDAELTPQLAATRAQLRSVRAGVDVILAAREAAASSRLARQNRRILRQVSGHLKDVKYQLKLRSQTLGETRAVHDRLERDIQDVERGIDKELQRAGLKDIEAVRAEVGEEVWERLNRRILRQVSGHLKDVKYQLKLRRQTLGETRAVHDRLERDIRDAQQGIDKELQRAGLKDIEAVRAEVGEEVWERLVRDAEAEE
ncbi:hypothetical protein HYQ44_011679 [Verticillium longisporum]|nr:hypothetical protein HYQ44_011679 [Verticillium longisporum]